MARAVIIILVFICVFLLIARIYTTKNKGSEKTSQSHGADESQGEASDGNGDE